MTNTYKVTRAEQPLAAISQLADDVVDVVRGYNTMLEKAEGELLPVVQRLHALHESHASKLLASVSELGGTPEKAGSVMGLVHSTVASARDWFGVLDGSALDQIIEGEERLVESYETALGEAAGHAGEQAMIVRQRDDLKAQIDALKR